MNGADFFDQASLIAAHDEGNAFDAVVPPIVQTSLFTFPNYDEMLETYRGEKVRPTYTRGLNPTVRTFEEMLAKLEGAEDAIGFASGMSAISSAVLSFIEPGDRIVAVRHIYPDAFRLFGTLLARMRIEVTYVDGRDEAAVASALPGAKLFYMESPTSWVMETHDIGALAALAKSRGIPTIIDNSWASPVFQRPLSLGVDVVVHSASKYLGGHSDVVAGVVAGSKELIGRIRGEAYPYLGGKLSPFDAWLLIRGLRTLPIRMRAHQASGLEIARRLRDHPIVERVCHPGLPTCFPRGSPARRACSHLSSATASTSAPLPTASSCSSWACRGAATKASSCPARSCCSRRPNPIPRWRSASIRGPCVSMSALREPRRCGVTWKRRSTPLPKKRPEATRQEGNGK